MSKYFLNLALVLGSILIAGSVLEVYFRLHPATEVTLNNPYFYTKHIGRGRCKHSYSHYTEIYPLEFDVRGYYKKSKGAIDYFFNQFGARWTKPKDQPDRGNIIVLGDSFTYGFGLRYEDTYIYKTQELLKKDGLSFRFLNFSVPANDSRNCLADYKAINYIPHVAVLYGLNLNDLIEFPTSYVTNVAERGRWAIPCERSKLVNFVYTQIYKIRDRRVKIRELLDPANFEKKFFLENFNAIRKLNQQALAHHVHLVVAILPILIDLKQDTFRPVYEGIKKRLQEEDIQYVDLSAGLTSYRDSALWILPFDQHPNERADTIFAGKLEDFLKDYLRLLKESMLIGSV